MTSGPRVGRGGFTADQITVIPREQELATAEVSRRHGISSATFLEWKFKFGGMDVSDADRLKVLKDEIAKLKNVLAEAPLNAAMLRCLNGEHSDARCEA